MNKTEEGDMLDKQQACIQFDLCLFSLSLTTFIIFKQV